MCIRQVPICCFSKNSVLIEKGAVIDRTFCLQIQKIFSVIHSEVFGELLLRRSRLFCTLLVDAADLDFRSRFMQQSIIQFVDNLRVELPKEFEQYIFSYILNGNTGIIIQWVRSNYAVDENEIVNLLFSINQSALVNLNLKYMVGVLNIFGDIIVHLFIIDISND